MLILYDTFTGNTKRFVDKLPGEFQVQHIDHYDGHSNYFLVTYTINFGQVPETTSKFLEAHAGKMLGVSSGGNRNWGLIEKGGTYGKAADILSKKYSVPIISKFELQGTSKDVDLFVQGVEKHGKYGKQMVNS